MPVSFDTGPGMSSPPDATDKQIPRTTQFFADRSSSASIGDQGAILRWHHSGEVDTSVQEVKEQPAGRGNALAMRFRAVHKASSACTEASQVACNLSSCVAENSSLGCRCSPKKNMFLQASLLEKAGKFGKT